MEDRGWSRQEEALYQELEQRAREQARALYARRREDPAPLAPPAPPPDSPRQPPARQPQARQPQTRPAQPEPGQRQGPQAQGHPARQGQSQRQSSQAGPVPQGSPQQYQGPPRQPAPPPPHQEPRYTPGQPPRFSIRRLLGGGTLGEDGQPGQAPDREWILLALLLYILVKEKADKELILALVYILLF